MSGVHNRWDTNSTEGNCYGLTRVACGVEATLVERFEAEVECLDGMDPKELEHLLKVANSILSQIDKPMTIAALMFSIAEVAEASTVRDITGYA